MSSAFIPFAFTFNKENQSHGAPLRRFGALRVMVLWGALALVVAPGRAQVGVSGKKLIEYGWDVPTPAQIRDEMAAMEKRPFDGLIFRLNGGHNAFVTTPLPSASFEQDRRILGSLQFNHFFDNFVLIGARPPLISTGSTTLSGA